MSGKNDVKPNGFEVLAGNQNDEQSTNLNPETDMEIAERLSNIFKRLDRDGNGRINIQDLTCALKGVGMSTQYAEVSIMMHFILISNRILI